jgi:pimeloyl-ACP methyl ester carboxylesterase
MKMVFIHGAGATGAVWHYQKQHFSDGDFVDLPGRKSGQPLSSIDEYRDWLRAHVEDKRLDKPVLIGQSMGGGIALSYALAFPDGLAGIVLIGSGARLRVNPSFLKTISDNVDNPPSWFRGAAQFLFSGVDPAVCDTVLDELSTIPIRVHLNDFLCCDRFDVMERVGEIKIPVLILCGDADIMTPVKYSHFLADRIAGSQLVVIPGAGHMPFLEKPDDVNGEIDAFMRSRGQ